MVISLSLGALLGIISAILIWQRVVGVVAACVLIAFGATSGAGIGMAISNAIGTAAKAGTGAVDGAVPDGKPASKPAPAPDRP